MKRPYALLLWLAVLATAATGLGQAWMRYMLEPVDDFSAWNHPWQGTTEALHALFGPVLALGLGAVLAGHAAARWRHPDTSRGARRGGVVLVAAVLVLVVTGGWLTGFPDPDGDAVAWAHGIAGGLLVVGMAVHGRTARSR